MAFNFRWTPLAADQSFYTRAQELLTTALNKSPKPPIIVDDIIVTELNLGDVPPDLDVLEIGDLDVDRFRGIFQATYSGNAFLTLRTRVQANPLNTFLSAKPRFTSPQPLAASSGLTIPIAITLSEIKLSAIVVLVYSREKGITLVFRNDPLESLKVSSTFDAIPFVRNYLQNEIESQLRTLLMDDLPLIIHRLSLRLFQQEHLEHDSDENPAPGLDPLAEPPPDPVDRAGVPAEGQNSVDPGPDAALLFSQKNLIRLGALTDSHRTLSLFTPSIRDTVFRAWVTPLARGQGHNTPALPRSQSYAGNIAAKHVSIEMPQSARPASSQTREVGFHSDKPRRRRRKHRVVNLRQKTAGGDDQESISGYSTTTSGTNTGPGTTEAGTPLSSRSETGERPATPEVDEPGNSDIGPTPPQYKSIDVTPRETTVRPKLQRNHSLRPIDTNPNASGHKQSVWMDQMASKILQKAQQRPSWSSEVQDEPPPTYGNTP